MKKYATGGYTGGPVNGPLSGPKPWNGYCDNLYRFIFTTEQYEHIMTPGKGTNSGTIMVTLSPADLESIRKQLDK